MPIPKLVASGISRRGLLAGAAAGFVAEGALACAPGAPAADSPARRASPRTFTFSGGSEGTYPIVEIRTVVGEPLAPAARLRIEAHAGDAPASAWQLRGVTSNTRYIDSRERDLLAAKQVAWGRPTANRGALLPIRKSARWWALPQADRLAIFQRSRHVEIGLAYLPAVARQLHHCRDLGEEEPFDFLTLFDFTEQDAAAFDRMLVELRATEEWQFVDREVDIRFTK